MTNPIPSEPRDASSPIAGAARQTSRIVLGAFGAWLARYIGADAAGGLVGTLDLVVFGAVQVGLAAAGKKLRDKGNPFGVLF